MTQPIFPDLKDASVFVTGGGSGIGAALTEGFLRQGARVAFIGRSDYSGFVAEMAQATGNWELGDGNTSLKFIEEIIDYLSVQTIDGSDIGPPKDLTKTILSGEIHCD